MVCLSLYSVNILFARWLVNRRSASSRVALAMLISASVLSMSMTVSKYAVSASRTLASNSWVVGSVSGWHWHCKA